MLDRGGVATMVTVLAVTADGEADIDTVGGTVVSVITRFDVPLITFVEGPDQQYAAGLCEGVRRRCERVA